MDKKNTLALPLLLEVAIRAAKAAGQHALKNKDRRTVSTETFSHDVKLVLDVECQQVAERVINAEFPDHGILGEEEIRPNPTTAYEWVIDPIDGTMNYTHDFPYWCCSIAVRRGDTVVAGCVYDPESDACYTAHLDDLPRLNGKPIRVSETDQLCNAIVFTGISKQMESSEEPHFARFRALALHTQKLRINGSAALDLCHLAAGTSDGFFEASLYLWDYAAAGLIAERAGAVLWVHPHPTEPHGATVLAANPSLIGGLRKIWNEV